MSSKAQPGVLGVAAAQRMNDLRRLEREARAGAGPRSGSRPAAPSPPVEVTATELAALKQTLEENTVELQKSQAALRVRRRPTAALANATACTNDQMPVHRRSDVNASMLRQRCRSCG